MAVPPPPPLDQQTETVPLKVIARPPSQSRSISRPKPPVSSAALSLGAAALFALSLGLGWAASRVIWAPAESSASVARAAAPP